MKKLTALFLFGLMGLFVSCVTVAPPIDVNENPRYVEFKERHLQMLENNLAGSGYINLDVYRIAVGDQFGYTGLYNGHHSPYYDDFCNALEEYTQRVEEHNAMVAIKQAEREANKDDVDFLLESSSYFIDFSKRSDEQLEAFVAKSHIILSVSSVEGAKTDRRTFDIFQNLLKHYTKAGEILYDHDKLSKDSYNDLRIAALLYDRNLKNMLYR